MSLLNPKTDYSNLFLTNIDFKKKLTLLND